MSKLALRALAASLAAAYLAIGAYCAWGLHLMVPAANGWAFLYMTAAWPSFHKASPWHPPVPAWMFDFPRAEAGL